MSDIIPYGFELMPRTDEYSKAFGPIYLNSAEQKIGFFVAHHHLNPAGVCHGGALATFADLQFGAIRACLKGSRKFRPTLTLTLEYFAPAPLGAWIEAKVAVVSAARGVVTTRAIITADGRLTAQSRATYHAGEDYP
jgi:uncharacterized protein (TIGR00369 family)